jgi:thimet oligopeptidase
MGETMDYESVKSKSLQVLSQLDWTLIPDQIRSRAQDLTKLGDSEYDKIISIPKDQRNFDNTIKKMDEINLRLSHSNASIYFPAYSSTDAEIRKASSEATQAVSKYYISLSMREDLYEAVKDAKANSYDKLDEIDKRLADRMLRDYRRNGLDLDDVTKSKVKEIKEELSKLSIEFSQVLNELTDIVEFSNEELEGVPEEVIKSFKKNDDGKYVVGMSYPEVLPVMDYAKNAESRYKISKVYGNRGVAEGNVERLEKGIQLRDQLAHLMGYDNHAEYVLEVKMAKNSANVMEFLNDLILKLKSKGQSDLELLIEEKKNQNGELANKINFEDWRYFKRIVTEKKYEVDEEVIKEYFPMKPTVDGMLQFYQDLLSLKFVELPEAPKWHVDVQVFAILDKSSEEFIGIFYLDLFPRDGKYNHAAAFPLIRGRKMEDGTYSHPIAAMECNFNKPTIDAPSLLKHDEVTTLYHEFGHIMHQTVTKSRYAEFSGTSVSRDFVEAPSQMLENWIWEPSILSKITAHYKTGEPMPEDLVTKLVNSRYAFSGLTDLRQLFIGKYDMIAHTNSSLQSAKLWHELYPQVALIDSLAGTNPAASVGHLFSGYDAGYYGYMWSLVIAQDMYTKFQKEGITSPEAGMAYRKYILEMGNDFDETDIVEKFLGRKISNEAFLKALGISD